MLKLLCLVVFVAGASATRVDEDGLDGRIFGGVEATHGQFPFQVSLRGKNGSFHFCGGSILSNRFVLTAAHCTQGRMSQPHYVRAVVGAHTRNGTDGTHYALDRIVSHPNFNADTLENDIAVLHTIDRIKFNEFVRPIALPTADVLANIPATVSGWGRFKVSSVGINSVDCASV